MKTPQAGGEGKSKPVPGTPRVDSAPLLVERMSMTPLKGGLARLTLRSSQQVAVDLSRDSLHLTCHEPHELAEHAGWGPDRKVPWERPGTPGGGAPVMH